MFRSLLGGLLFGSSSGSSDGDGVVEESGAEKKGETELSDEGDSYRSRGHHVNGESIPDDVWVYVVARFLRTREVVCGLSMCCRRFRLEMARFVPVDVWIHADSGGGSNYRGIANIPLFVSPWKNVKILGIRGISHEHSLCVSPSMLAGVLNFNSSLEELDLSFSLGLDGTELQGLTKLKKLVLNQCFNVDNVTKLPENIEYLSLSGCYRVENVDLLPKKSMKVLCLSNCQLVRNISNLPSSLEELDVSLCWRITSVRNLPPRLRRLNLSGASGITDFSHLPDKFLAHLDLSGCEITDVSVLPRSVRRLNLQSCRHIMDLRSLPPHCEELDISKCLRVSDLSQLPSSLRFLDLRGCYGISDLKSLGKSRSDSGCKLERVFLPEHL